MHRFPALCYVCPIYGIVYFCCIDGFFNISPYVFGWSCRTASSNVFMHSSSTSIVSLLYRWKVVNVCDILPGDVIMRPYFSFMLRIVLSAYLCCIRRMFYMVGCSPSSLSTSSFSMRIVFSLSLWSLTIFCF